MIRSICDTDLYKFSMSYAYQQLFPEAIGEFQFVDRAKTVYDEKFIQQLEMGLAEMCALKLKDSEATAAFSLVGRWIPLHYWEWLKTFQFDRGKIKISLDEEKHLHISVEDHMYKATLYEVPLLALVSEVRNRWLGNTYNEEKMIADLEEKIKLSNQEQLYFSEFGTRRRFSSAVQEKVCEILREKAQYYVGTSNVYEAAVIASGSVKCLGTMAHEYLSMNGAFYGYRQGNYMALENWQRVFHGNLGIALTDTWTNSIFFNNLSREHALLFNGLRHDSGDPYKFITMAVNRYKELGIDPTTKSLIFSNALTMLEFKDIRDASRGRVKSVSAGIGTNLTAIPEQVKPANIVMKLWKVRMSDRQPWIYTVKLSDDPGKATGDPKEVELAKLTLGIE